MEDNKRVSFTAECTLKYHIHKHVLHNVTQECGEERSSGNENTLQIPTTHHICTMYFEAHYKFVFIEYSCSKTLILQLVTDAECASRSVKIIKLT